MLDAYVRSEDHQFPQNTVYLQDGGLHHITYAVSSILDALFPHLWIARHGLTGRRANKQT